MSPLAAIASLVQIPATASVHWGVIYISLTNLVIILLMVVVFVLALLVPFPHAREPEAPGEPQHRSDAEGSDGALS